MLKYLFFGYVFLCSITLFAQTPYDITLIPSHLRSRANMIIRHYEATVDMKAKNNVLYTVTEAITIFNKNGEAYAALNLFYDKNTILKAVKGEIYNDAGILQTRISLRDFRDESAVSGFSLYEDSRVKRYAPVMTSYPYTIFYQYEIIYKQNLIIPGWYPKPADDIAVEKSSFSFICRPTDKFRIKARNLSNNPSLIEGESQKKLTWTINALPATKSEPLSPSPEIYLPSLKIAPDQFKYYQYEAEYRDWKGLGKWIYDDLLKDRSILPSSTVELVRDMVRSETNNKAKVRKIYDYLQQKTRYISVQIGIGGFKPFSAADVDRLGYGDCKALVNYMQCLLKTVDIDSYYCIVNAGVNKKSLDTDFASMDQANHVILCVPLPGDTTWLECTSQTIPFGFLSDFTDDRRVLACTPDGGKLLNTPHYTGNQNRIQRSANFTLDKNGILNGNITSVFTGIRYDDHIYLKDKASDEQLKLLKEAYPLDNVNFNNISYKEDRKPIPTLTETFTISAPNYGLVNKQNIIFNIQPFPVRLLHDGLRNRNLPIEIQRGSHYEDHINYTIHQAFGPLTEPIEKTIESSFGKYHLKITIEGNTLTYSRVFILNEGLYASTAYIDFANFINSINTAEQLRYISNLR